MWYSLKLCGAPGPDFLAPARAAYGSGDNAYTDPTAGSSRERCRKCNMKKKHNLLFILITGLLFTTGFYFVKISQDVSELEELNRRLQQQNTALEQKLIEAEKQFRERQATLIYVLSGRGKSIPVLSPSGFTGKMYEQAWEALGASGLAGTGEAVVRAEKATGVNGLVLAAMAYLESGGGGSRIAAAKNNLFGLGAADSNPYAQAFSFESKEDSIFYAASMLSRNYLSREGRYYRGGDLHAVGKYYASDPLWAEKVSRTMLLIVFATAEAEG